MCYSLGWGVLQFYFGKADSHVNEKLPHTVKNSLFPDFRAFCYRNRSCRIPTEAELRQTKTSNVCNLRESLPFIEHCIELVVIETKEAL